MIGCLIILSNQIFAFTSCLDRSQGALHLFDQ